MNYSLHPDAPPVPAGYAPNKGVTHGCGQADCPACYHPEDPAEKARVKFAELVQEALSIQDACNLSGLSKRFAEVTSELWEIERAGVFQPGGTAWVNSNQVTRLWISKFLSLAGDVRSEDWQTL